MSLLVFNIKTIPDVAGGRRLYDIEGLTDKEVSNVMFHKRRQETGTEELRLHLHRIVSISVVRRTAERLEVCSLGTEKSSEAEIIQNFFSAIDKPISSAVSWNGNVFDLPILHYRSLVHGIQAPHYWAAGDGTPGFKHHGYTDLRAILAGQEMQASAPLDEISSLMGFPGKITMEHFDAWDSYQQGDLNAIRNHGEVEVLNIYLLYLRFELVNGSLSHDEYETECDKLKTFLSAKNKLHLNQFLNAWQR